MKYLVGREGLSRVVASHSPVRMDPSYTGLGCASLQTLQKILGEPLVDPDKAIINHHHYLHLVSSNT